MLLNTRNCLLGAGLLLLLGNQIPRISLISGVEAAPKEVFGSPNVAVDTYRNRKGSYVVFSDGRITNTKGDVNTDLGHPYADPDASTGIKKSDDVKERPKGSPNVAVKALVRSDATYILFADGSLRKPSNADAALGGADGQRILMGTFPTSAGLSLKGDGWSAGSGASGGVIVTFDQAFDKPPTVMLQAKYDAILPPAGVVVPAYPATSGEKGFTTSDLAIPTMPGSKVASSVSFVVVGQ